MSFSSPVPSSHDERALRLHRLYRGKIQTLPKCPVSGLEDFQFWYTPGVAAPSREIAAKADSVYEYTNRGNTIAVVSDGSRVLGLGDIGPEAALPVMEGKALLFKYLGGVDAVPICLATRDPDEIVETVKRLEPSFGGINLEDISQPKCFRILTRLQRELEIPVWHDDQQGTAVAVLAGLINACKVVGKDLASSRIALIGVGAAGVAIYRLLHAYGVDPAGVVACDSRGILSLDREDLKSAQEHFMEKWQICRDTNAENRRGGIAEALADADICLAFSKSEPGLIRGEWVRRMRKDGIVFACANPEPEIWPEEALAAGARIVATGRGDFPNQVNNSLSFPGIFRGVLDVRASRITEEMSIAAAEELAAHAEERGLNEERIVPTMADWEVFVRVAIAVATKAQEQGEARSGSLSRADLEREARETIRRSRDSLRALMAEGIIAAEPEGSG